MRSGCVKTDNADFTGAQHDFEAALAEAQRLNDKEAESLSTEMLSSTSVRLGNFQAAEKFARQRIALVPSSDAYHDLSWAVELQGRYDEAAQIQKEHFMSSSEFKKGKSIIPTIKAAIGKEWHPKKTYNTAWAVARFNIPGIRPDRIVGYIRSSTGDEPLEQASLAALGKIHCAFTQLPSNEQFPVLFSFNYNVLKGPYDPEPLNKYEMARDAYKILRNQLVAQEKNLGPDNPEYIATMLAATNKLREIQPSDATSAKAFEHILNSCDSHGIRGTLLYSALLNYGQVLLSQHDFAKAEPVLARANKLKLELYSADSVFEPDPTQLLAKALTKLHRGAEAKALLSTLPKQ